jgi:hypothetical protein
MTAPHGRILLAGPYRHLGGRQWYAGLPPGLDAPSDAMATPAASPLALFEDATPLGPRHAVHADIEELGGGRYSHWEGGLRFSTSDGSDPNGNGRTYSVTVLRPTLRMLVLGSCNTAAAAMMLHGRDGVASLWPDAPPVYSLRETLQLLRHFSGRSAVPAPLRRLCIAVRVSPDAAAMADGVDVLFLELGSSIDVAFGGVWLPRAEIMGQLVGKLAALGREHHRAAHAWYNHGLIRRSETVRRDCAALLAAALPRIDTDRALAAAILSEARGDVLDLDGQRAALAEIRDIVRPRALCIVTAHNAYLPDGRALSWPVDYPRQLETICAGTDVALLHTSALVARHGTAFALERDGRHFTADFIGVLADAMREAGRRALGLPDAA